MIGYIGLEFEDYQEPGGDGVSHAPFGGGPGGAPTGGPDTEDNADIQVDEAYIKIGDIEGLYGIFGKQYFPFGNIDEYGNFINDTLSRQLFETRDTGITIGHEYEGLEFNLFAFNGNADQVRNGIPTHTDNKIDTWGGSVSYKLTDEDRSMKLGFSYLDNIFQAQSSVGLGQSVYSDHDNQAYNLHAVFEGGPVWFGVEYVSAFNNLDKDVDGNNMNDIGSGVKPEALTLEGAVTCDLGGNDVTLAAKWEIANDQDDFTNAVEEIWAFGISSEILENTTLTVNYENWNLAEQASPPTGSSISGSTPKGGHANVYLAELSIGF